MLFGACPYQVLEVMEVGDAWQVHHSLVWQTLPYVHFFYTFSTEKKSTVYIHHLTRGGGIQVLYIYTVVQKWKKKSGKRNENQQKAVSWPISWADVTPIYGVGKKKKIGGEVLERCLFVGWKTKIDASFHSRRAGNIVVF